MNNPRKLRSVGRAILAVVALTAILVVWNPPYPTSLGDYFSISTVWIIVGRGGVYIGAIFILIRILNLVKNNSNIFYLSIGVINFISGILAVILFFMNKMELQFFHDFLLNLLVGALIFSDVILFDQPET